MQAAEQANLDRIAKQKSRLEIPTPLEPLLVGLVKGFVDDADLTLKLRNLYKSMDSNGNGSLSCAEICRAIKNLDPRIHLSESDFLDFTENGELCNSAGEIGPMEFETIMRRKIHTFVQTRLTDFSDCRTAADMELTSMGALKTIVSEVLIMAREQQKASSQMAQILNVLTQLQISRLSAPHDSESKADQAADALLQSSRPSGSNSDLRPQIPEGRQSSLSLLELSTHAMLEVSFVPENKVSQQLYLDTEPVLWNNAADISLAPREDQVIIPGAWRQSHAQEKTAPNDSSAKIFEKNVRPGDALSKEIDGCESHCETDKSEGLCTKTEDISADCLLVPPVPSCAVQSANTGTPKAQLQALTSNGVGFLSESSTSHGSQQSLCKCDNQAVCSSTLSCSEILIPDGIPDVRPSPDLVEIHGREITVQVSEGSTTAAVGDLGNGSACEFETCSVLYLCHNHIQASGTSQNAIDITPSLNFGPQHLSSQWDPAAQYPDLT
eukprot:CAMPEP_0172175582 /NCGR_PEP_ID=MMETSP1050-20130122/14314_1 /TAXON_ID=233186 /ORGANISM="Cryptomonas curvata, Strain CCAP979/52" /LENGTH=495 /DNA_ID=CAMNT_0012847713 /DNA_START=581 /DNA_END=2068 /DNA_ORIENTATION=-